MAPDRLKKDWSAGEPTTSTSSPQSYIVTGYAYSAHEAPHSIEYEYYGKLYYIRTPELLEEFNKSRE